MQDISLIRNDTETLLHNLKRRKQDHLLNLVKEVKVKDELWREVKQKEDDLRHRRNNISEQINEAKKKGEDAQHLIEQAREIPKELDQVHNRQIALKKNRDAILKRLPNTIHESVPYGEDDEDNKEIKRWGTPKNPDFDLLSHRDLAEKIGGAHFDRSAKISGHGFYFLKGELALMNQALIQFTVQTLVGEGYEYHEPPLMMRREAYETGVQIEDFEEVMYGTEDDMYMIATSEAPMLAQFMNETLSEDALPIKMCSYSMCFRKEVGSRGVDTKGLYRTHQFNKVEQIAVTKPENSWKMHEELQKNAEKIHQLLELPYRVVNVCTGDLGSFAAKKYDIEAWMPRRQTFGETCSNSNYTDYQARRANIRYHKEDTNTYPYPHTLNATGVATSRVMVAILENYQNEDGSLTIPKVLRAYMNGRKVILSK